MMSSSVGRTVVAAVAVVAISLTYVPAVSAKSRDDGSTTSQADFARKVFSHPTTIDNVWTPLVPGTRLVFEGEVTTTQSKTKHKVEFIVTDLTKVIAGVRTVVVWDRDFDQGELQESELAFEAQDDDGNVWNLGEYPEEYEDGKLSGAPSTWLAGVEGAKAGLLMRATPRRRTPKYVQGSSPRIDFLDVAKVKRTHQHTCVKVGCFDDVLVIDESSPLEPDSGHQLKFYAPGVGNVRIDPVGGEEEESLVLVKVEHLRRKALTRASQRALKLDTRAYAVAHDVYKDTPPARR